MTEKRSKISEAIALQFGSTLFALQLVVAIAGTYVAFFMTDILGIGAATAGIVLTVGGIADTFGIFIIGGVVNNTQLKWGKYRSWMFIAPPILIVSYVLFFMNWSAIGMGEGAIAVLLIVLYTIQQFAVNTCTLASTGLSAVVGGTFEGRTKITARMQQFVSFSRVVSGAIFLWFVAWAGGGNDAKGYSLYMLVFGIITLLAYFNLARVAKPYDVTDANTAAVKEINKLSLGDMWKVLSKNDQFVLFILAQIVMDFGIMFSYMAMAYFFMYVVGDLNGMTLYLTTSTIAAVAGNLLGPSAWKLLKSKKKLFIFSLICYAAGFLSTYFIFLITGGINLTLFLVIINIAIVLFNMHGAIKPTFYMDIAEYGYHKNGKDSLAFMMSFSNVSFKIAVAVAGGAVGFALAAIGYQAGQLPTPELINKICFVVMGFPSISFIIAGLLFAFGYKLTDEKVKVIMQENEAKKAAILATEAKTE